MQLSHLMRRRIRKRSTNELFNSRSSQETAFVQGKKETVRDSDAGNFASECKTTESEMTQKIIITIIESHNYFPRSLLLALLCDETVYSKSEMCLVSGQ